MLLGLIYDQWPKLYLGFNVELEIRILKVIQEIHLGETRIRRFVVLFDLISSLLVKQNNIFGIGCWIR